MRNIARSAWLIFVLAVVLLGGLTRTAVAVTLADEIDLGRKIDAEIMKQNKLYTDEQAQKEMEEYGQKLVKNVSRTQIPYHFKILKDNDFNAFSIPGGYVYFTDRLWNVLRKDERIGVIGHEITHVDRRHAINLMLDQQRRQILLSVLLTATRAGQLAGNFASMAEQMYSLKYSRTDEQQADEGSVKLCQKAGYNPAGILLAMYKIGRFESESGGAPPKIFSDHPPTKERLQYISQLLTSKGVPVPPEKSESIDPRNKIGQVLSVGSGAITFSSTKVLRPGDVVWVMRDGWDYYYEKRSGVPFARAVITSVGQSLSASVSVMPSTKEVSLAKGMDVCDPPAPAPPAGIGALKRASNQTSLAMLKLISAPAARERLFAVQAVWNKDGTQLIQDRVGYLVVINPASETGYLKLQRPKYSYAPMESNAVLIKFTDPDEQRWIGPVISIGRSGGTIEVLANKQIDKSKTYDVAYPAWNKDENYRKRVVGTAVFDSAKQKVVLRMLDYTPGWGADDLQNGFDVYEQAKQVK